MSLDNIKINNNIVILKKEEKNKANSDYENFKNDSKGNQINIDNPFNKRRGLFIFSIDIDKKIN